MILVSVASQTRVQCSLLNTSCFILAAGPQTHAPHPAFWGGDAEGPIACQDLVVGVARMTGGAEQGPAQAPGELLLNTYGLFGSAMLVPQPAPKCSVCHGLCSMQLPEL